MNKHLRLKSFSLFMLLLFFTCLTIQAQEQSVTVKLKKVSLTELFKEIEKQTSYRFSYRNTVVDNKNDISISKEKILVSQVLDEILAGKNLDYSIISAKSIVIFDKKSTDKGKKKINISGIVTDDKGEPIIGASILLQGTSNGMITDLSGNFSLEASSGDVLEISYIGYMAQQVTVGTQPTVKITMFEDTNTLEEVVVTALGIRRSQKALSYNVQEIKADAVNTVKTSNFVSSLAGKVAGVQINSSSSGVGGAARVVMRGTKSLMQDNNAMYVIDGIPMFNVKGDDESGQFASAATSESIADINSDDIESMSVLTGAAAAALYGAQAANGVILITTKKGKVGKAQLAYSNNTDFMSPFKLPEFQQTYGNRAGEFGSWGDQLKTPSTYDPAKFFQTGLNETNSLSLSVGNEKNQTYVSLSATHAKGLVPQNKYSRYNFTFRNTTSFLNDKMTLNIGGSYINQSDQNMIRQGQYMNPLVPVYLFPRGEDFASVRLYETFDEGRQLLLPNWNYGENMAMQNPYWIINRQKSGSNKQRYMFNVNLKYEILEGLNVTGRASIDNSMIDYQKKYHAGTLELFSGKKGFYSQYKQHTRAIYADAMVNYEKQLSDFHLAVHLGSSMSDDDNDLTGYQGPLKDIPNLFSLKNTDISGRDARPLETWSHIATHSVFGSMEVGYKSMLYLSLTARNDWDSRLANTASEKKGFFYPSVGLSGILSEMVKMPEWLTYAKVRASYSKVGSAPKYGLTCPVYPYDNSTNSWQTIGYLMPDSYKPEDTRSWELGLSLKFLNNDLSLDFTYYHSNTYNQTFQPKISASGGYSSMIIQSGDVMNEGIEAGLGYHHTWNKFTWNSNFTFSMNKNKIKKLLDNYKLQNGTVISVSELEAGAVGDSKFLMKKGGSMGDLYTTTDLLRDGNGKVFVDSSTGSIGVAKDIKFVGSVLPKANLSFSNNFSWKGISAGAMLSARLGGVVMSSTQAALDFYGVSKATADARSNGGVPINNGMVDAEKYYTTLGAGSGVLSHYIYDATNIRLQEAFINYTLPRSWLGNKVGLTVGVVGRNLLMIYCKAPFDPEATASTGTFYQGVDYFMLPSTRNLGFNVKLEF